MLKWKFHTLVFTFGILLPLSIKIEFPLLQFIRRLKPAYTLYNLLHKKQLSHNRHLLEKFNIDHSPYNSLDSTVFKKYEAPFQPPLDLQNSKEVLPKIPYFKSLPENYRSSLTNWSDKGYAVLNGFLNDQEVQTINEEVDRMIDAGQADWHYSRPRIMFAIRKSSQIKKLITESGLQNILSMLLGRELLLFQSINFLEGSQQSAHSDAIHMTTFPKGFLIAAWIALEDIDEENGPLFYYPGSHRLPYLMNKDYDHGGSKFLIGKNANSQYEKAVQQMIKTKKLKAEKFYARKGDVLIWHANLIHGGSPVINKERSRKSMVLHYFAKDVICYHEMTQRPALIPENTIQ